MRPWRQRFVETYEEDRDYWLGRGFTEVDARPDRQVSFRGVVTVRRRAEGGFESTNFELEVLYPPGYPYIAPTVRFIKPPIDRARHQSPGGEPCLFPPGAWNLGRRPSELYESIESWLAYLLAGRFPNELALYELPEYFNHSTLTVLAPGDVLARFTGRDHGRFSVDELLGQDVAVLRTVDGKTVGDTLRDALSTRSIRTERYRGDWFRLEGEPPPLRWSHELLAFLEEQDYATKIPAQPSERRLLAFIFPDAVLEEERLFFLDLGASAKAKPKAGRGWPIRAPATYCVSRADLFRRLEGVRQADALEEKTVACLGLGAIGSSVALTLAREGVGSFALADPDTLRPGNVMRHALDLSSTGRYKAEAVDDALGRVNPEVETSSQVTGLSDPAVLETVLAGADLVIAAIGNDSKEEMLGELVAEASPPQPMILVRTLHAGAAFRIALVRPGQDACLFCLAVYRNEEHPDWIDLPKSELTEVFDEGCATGSMPGAGNVSQLAALHAASRAIEVLEAGAAQTNHWLWVERAIDSGDPRLRSPLTLHTATFSPRPNCPLCSA